MTACASPRAYVARPAREVIRLRVDGVAHVAELDHHRRDVRQVQGGEVGAEVEAVAAGDVVRDRQPDPAQGGPGVEGQSAATA